VVNEKDVTPLNFSGIMYFFLFVLLIGILYVLDGGARYWDRYFLRNPFCFFQFFATP
jgi:hypothetical protein